MRTVTVGPCGWAHFAAMAVPAGSRFDPLAKAGYRARSGGLVRPTREAAIADECAAKHATPTPNGDR